MKVLSLFIAEPIFGSGVHFLKNIDLSWLTCVSSFRDLGVYSTDS